MKEEHPNMHFISTVFLSEMQFVFFATWKQSEK